MAEKRNQGARSPGSIVALEGMHGLMLQALRQREQDIIRYLAILVPSVGGFVWLLQSEISDVKVFIVGSVFVLLLLLLGAVYSLALGYNYRYITMELAKLEAVLRIRDAMLVSWPRSPEDFLRRYRLGCIPWCLPPEIIKIFWAGFLVAIIGVTIGALFSRPEDEVCQIVIPSGSVCLLVGFLSPIYFGYKLRKYCKKEPETWGIS